MKQICRLFHTLRYLHLRQIVWRLWYRYRPVPQLPLSINQHITLPVHQWNSEIYRPTNISQAQFQFMRITADLMAPVTWDNPDFPKLWRYHIQYFHDLNATINLSIAFWQTCLAQWTLANPPMQGTSWEPYPLSLRIVNWIIWHLRTGGLTPALIDHLHTQCRALNKQIEWHIDANHLWANAKALVFAGCFFSQNSAWYQQGMQLIHRICQEQFDTYGGHIELSPMYHALITQDLLELIALHQCYAKPLPNRWAKQVTRMLSWLGALTHPDGEYAFFNDCTFGIAPNYATLCHIARQLHLSVDLPLRNASGYVHHQAQYYTLIADTAAIGCSYQPGHAHADSLSFELSYGLQRMIVNSGISTYANHQLRHWQRSTAAHNTLTLNQQNSSEVWHAFRVAKRARIIKRYVSEHLIAAIHNGYSSCYRAILHSRQWHLQEHLIAITDHVFGKGQYDLDLYCYFHPLCHLELHEQRISVYLQERCIALLTFNKAAVITIQASHWYPRFGEAIPNQRLQIHFPKQSLPTAIHWDVKIY